MLLEKKAVLSNNEEDWRNYRVQRNKVNRINKTNKSAYYEKRLNINISGNVTTENIRVGKEDTFTYSDKTMWKTVRELTNNVKQLPPRILNCNSRVITSVR